MKKLLAHREQPIPELRAARSDVPASLESIFTRMVAKRPADRYAVMADVIRDLQGCVAGSPAAEAAGTVPFPAPAFPGLGSGTIGSEDPAVQEFVRGISPAASGPGGRTRAGTAAASETMASRVEDYTQTAGPAIRSRRRQRRFQNQRRLLFGGAVACVVVVAGIIWSVSGGKPKEK